MNREDKRRIRNYLLTIAAVAAAVGILTPTGEFGWPHLVGFIAFVVLIIVGGMLYLRNNRRGKINLR